MVDDPDVRVGADAAHLGDCAECQTRLKAVSDDARSIATLLAVPEAHIDLDRAFATVLGAPKAQPALGLRLPFVRPTARPLTLAFVTAVAAGALVVVAFAAGGFFFQPTTVKTVPITVADIQALSQLADYGTLTWTKEPQLQATTSAADAAAIAGGLQPPVVAQVPAGVSTTVTYGGMSEAQATFTFSAAKAAAAAAAKGKTLPKLPAEIDGATLTITVGPAVGEIYGEMNKPTTGSSIDQINLPQLIIAKSSSPKVTSTQVTAQQLEAYILAQPGISDQLTNAIK